MAEKTANQLYRESGTSLNFKEWLEREKDKGVFLKNQLLEDVTDSAIESENKNRKFIFGVGIPKWVIYSGIAILTIAVIYKYKR